MRAKPSLSVGENMQFIRYYQVCDTSRFIMEGPKVAGSQADILQDRRVWVSTASSIQIIRKILRDLVICIGL